LWLSTHTNKHIRTHTPHTQRTNDWSPEASFTTAPAASDANAETRVLLTADNGFYTPDNAYTPDGCGILVSPCAVLSKMTLAAPALRLSDSSLLPPPNPPPSLHRFSNGFTVTYLTPEEAATPTAPKYAFGQSMFVGFGAGPGQQPATKEVYSALAARAAVRPYHAWVINGDIAYSRGEAHQFDTFQAQAGAILKSVPGIFSVGNHEAGACTSCARSFLRD
jgi:hypothetical protein